LTLIDALDTLAIIGNYSEFRRVHNLLISSLDFDRDINVSVFETNIRGEFLKYTALQSLCTLFAGSVTPLHSTPLTGRAVKPQRQGQVGRPIAQP